MTAKAQLAPYLGQVATRSHFPNGLLTTGGNAFMSRSYHIMQVSVNGVQIAIPNWYVNAASGETTSGNAATVTASIEYPLGVFNQVKFGGSSSVSVTANTTKISDVCPVTIPAGAAFWVRIFFNPGAATLPYKSDMPKSTSLGDAQVYTGATDQTMSGTVTDTAGANIQFYPAAILGITNQPSFAIIGDSHTADTFDSVNDNTGLTGMFNRTVGAKYGFIGGGISGDTLAAVSGGLAPLRIALASYCSHVIAQIGYNDVGNGALLETMKSNYLRLHNFFPYTTKFILATHPGQTTSTDSWATLQNQTPNGNFVEGRAAVMAEINDWMRGNITGVPSVGGGSGERPNWIDGYIEASDYLMTARNASRWLVTGGANGYTNDGIHPNQAGCLLLDAALKASGIIDALAFATTPFYEANRNEKLAGTKDKDGVVTPTVQVSTTPQQAFGSAQNATVGTGSATALLANPNAKYRCFINTSANTIALGFHAAAVITQGVVLPPAPATGAPSMYEMSYAKGNMDTRDISAIASAASSNLAIVEMQ